MRKEDRIGFMIYDAEVKEVCAEQSEDGRIHSNNEAKYCNLYAGLQWCLEMGYKKVVAKGDTMLVVR